MTNVSSSPRKVATRRGLFRLAERALEAQGWTVSRIARGGKASLRQIKRGDEVAKVSIRTSQDAWIAFPRKTKQPGWVTLDDVDYVVAASVDDKLNPTEARVHMIPGDEARSSFNRAFAARKAANYTLPEGRGVWISLYDKESADPVTHVGAGLGLTHPPIAVHNLSKALPGGDDEHIGSIGDSVSRNNPLSINEAKRRLALSLGVPEEAIKISIEH